VDKNTHGVLGLFMPMAVTQKPTFLTYFSTNRVPQGSMLTPLLLTTGRKIHTLGHQIFSTFSSYFTLNKFWELFLSKPRQEGSHVHVHMHTHDHT
jgi:hypothetical protein